MNSFTMPLVMFFITLSLCSIAQADPHSAAQAAKKADEVDVRNVVRRMHTPRFHMAVWSEDMIHEIVRVVETEKYHYQYVFFGDRRNGFLRIIATPVGYSGDDDTPIVVTDRGLDGRVDMGIDRTKKETRYFYRGIQGDVYYSYWQQFYQAALAAALAEPDF